MAVSDILSAVPQPVQLGLAGIGALYVASYILSYIRLLLNLFVLSDRCKTLDPCLEVFSAEKETFTHTTVAIPGHIRASGRRRGHPFGVATLSYLTG